MKTLKAGDCVQHERKGWLVVMEDSEPGDAFVRVNRDDRELMERRYVLVERIVASVRARPVQAVTLP